MTAPRCPCCKQIIRDSADPPKPVKVCYDCGEPISRSHKWTIQPRQGLTVLVHRVCSNPTSYYRAAECAKIGVVGYKNLSPEQILAATEIEDELEFQFSKWREANGRKVPTASTGPTLRKEDQ